jgi:hypothetical protein
VWGTRGVNRDEAGGDTGKKEYRAWAIQFCILHICMTIVRLPEGGNDRCGCRERDRRNAEGVSYIYTHRKSDRASRFEEGEYNCQGEIGEAGKNKIRRIWIRNFRCDLRRECDADNEPPGQARHRDDQSYLLPRMRFTVCESSACVRIRSAASYRSPIPVIDRSITRYTRYRQSGGPQKEKGKKKKSGEKKAGAGVRLTLSGNRDAHLKGCIFRERK